MFGSFVVKIRGMTLGLALVTLTVVGCDSPTPPLPEAPPVTVDPAKAPKKDKSPAPLGPEGLVP